MTDAQLPHPAIKAAARAQLCANLAALGIGYVHIDYDGSGDSGCIETIDLYDAARNSVHPPKHEFDVTLFKSVWNPDRKAYDLRPDIRTVPAQEAIEAWCYDLLEEHFSGWEIDDGAYGTIVIDVAACTVKLIHNDRYTAIETHTLEV